MKKLIAKWKSKRIVLTEEDYEILLERFDIKNFIREKSFYSSDHSSYYNKIVCPLCKKYTCDLFVCRGCTFNKFRSRSDTTAGCITLLAQISKEIGFESSCLILGRNRVLFRSYYRSEAIKAIKYIRKLILTEFKIVEE